MASQKIDMQKMHALLSDAGVPLPLGRYYVAAQQGTKPAGKGVQMTPLKTISEKLTAWRRYREAVRELSQLSDRELDDIGIRRGDIEYIVRRSVASKASA
jgi:uncharacterized protein YjiS (DUF1127 family)